MMITEKVEKDNYTIVRTKGSNKVWQFSMWIKKEKKYYRATTGTRNTDQAIEFAQTEIKNELSTIGMLFKYWIEEKDYL